MSADTEKQPGSIERLVCILKQLLSEEPTEGQLAELGESLLATVKAALSGTH